MAFVVSFCLDSSLNRTKARGKILICRRIRGSSESRVSTSMVVKEAGAAGMILIDEMGDHVANHFAVPGTVVGEKMGDEIISYIKSTRLIKPTIEVYFISMSVFFLKLILQACQYNDLASKDDLRVARWPTGSSILFKRSKFTDT